MPQQELKGIFVILCPACRGRAPMFVDGKFEWRCSHRKATVREATERRFIALDNDSDALGDQHELSQ